jgi:hypothetical protein
VMSEKNESSLYVYVSYAGKAKTLLVHDAVFLIEQALLVVLLSDFDFGFCLK